jgi:type II secretory pathway predicted ATPase ExeA
MGKTLVLGRALAAARDPRRRFAWVQNPFDGGHLFARLAQRLGARRPRSARRVDAWLALEQVVREHALQGFHVVLAVDDCSALMQLGAMDDVHRLLQADVATGCQVTVLLAMRPDEPEARSALPPWTLAFCLLPLTRSETEAYFLAKLAAAGASGRLTDLFTDQAVTRLHLHSRGNPSTLNRLGSRCLGAAAARGLRIISAELVDSLVHEMERVPQTAFERRVCA